jgi:hypothetical protein
MRRPVEQSLLVVPGELDGPAQALAAAARAAGMVGMVGLICPLDQGGPPPLRGHAFKPTMPTRGQKRRSRAASRRNQDLHREQK